MKLARFVEAEFCFVAMQGQAVIGNGKMQVATLLQYSTCMPPSASTHIIVLSSIEPGACA